MLKHAPKFRFRKFGELNDSININKTTCACKKCDNEARDESESKKSYLKGSLTENKAPNGLIGTEILLQNILNVSTIELRNKGDVKENKAANGLIGTGILLQTNETVAKIELHHKGDVKENKAPNGLIGMEMILSQNEAVPTIELHNEGDVKEDNGTVPTIEWHHAIVVVLLYNLLTP